MIRFCKLKLFGCDGVMNGGMFDECGVCNGDGMLCDVVEGIFIVLFIVGMMFCYCWFDIWEIKCLGISRWI